ncbi:FAD-binding oxidoreductase [Inquilinus limosus]|uniref:NAD(P)/FAD-dependent oxidoreductase n=1 Tax=Inquilinus limosus TaxID=171674 RepID=UPI003F13EB49
MTKRIDTEVAIIGGGIVGVCTAYHLAKAGSRVTLLERGAVGAQASGVNFGGLRTNGRAEAELPLSLRAKALWQRIEALVGHRCEVEATGHLEVADRPSQMAAIEDWAKVARAHGIRFELLGGAEIAARFPWLRGGMIGGCYVPDDGAANPRLVTPVFALAARRLGADIREFQLVRELQHDGDRFRLVAGTGLEIRAETLVNAAGAWATRLAAAFGEHFPLDVMAPQMTVSEPMAHRIAATVDYAVNGRYFYARQVRRGNVLFGQGPGRADLDLGRAWFLPQNGFDASRIAIDLLPVLRGRSFIRTWSGVEGKSPDSLPFLGFSRAVPGLIHAFGFSGHGFQLGPGTGAVVAELARSGRTSTEIEAFDPYRFQRSAAAA